MSRKPPGAALLLGLLSACPLLFSASSRLLFIELQSIAGYSTAAQKVIFYSQNAMEAMQKPSLGFDLVQRISGRGGDVALLALQARLAVKPNGETTLEPQVYNAYLKFKLRPANVWIGHNRPAFGLASRLDSHALLLQPLAMHGFGFDRDWGTGLERDFAWGGAALSLTTGSGMRLELKGSYLVSGRVSLGILDRDNHSAGLSLAAGRTADVMGVHRMSGDRLRFAMAAADITWLSDNFENRFEAMAGSRGGRPSWALLWRGGVNLLDENRLKIELQPALWRLQGATNFELGAGVTFLATADLTVRAIVQHDAQARDWRLVCQIYYTKGLRL